MSPCRDAARGLRAALSSYGLRLAVSFGCAVLAVAAWAAPAAAHGVLVASDPVSGAVMARAPRTAVLTFNEAIVGRLSQARLLDRSGRVLDGVVSTAAGSRLTLRLPELGAGAYSVAWRVLTVGDGHRTDGVVAFAVGPASATASVAGAASAPAAPASGDEADAANRAGGADGAARRGWARLSLLGGLAAVTVLLRRVIVSRPRRPELVVPRHDSLAASAACAGAVLLLTAALLARNGPSPAPLARGGPPPASPAVPSTIRSATVNDLLVVVSVTPNRAGVNGFTVTAASSRRPPPAPIDGVALESPSGDTPLRQLEPGRYVGTGQLGGAASTRLTVVVQRGGRRLRVPIPWSLG